MASIDLHLEWFLADDDYVNAYPKAPKLREYLSDERDVIDVDFTDLLDAPEGA